MRRELRRWMEDHAPSNNDKVLEPAMTIGEAARITQLSESALRKYETAGLITYHRSSGNVRVLSPEDLQRITRIQDLIKKKGLNLEGIRRLWSLMPCWEIKGCTNQDRSDCNCSSKENRPCWMICRDHHPDRQNRCRACEVYRMAPLCTDEIKFLVQNTARPSFHLEEAGAGE